MRLARLLLTPILGCALLALGCLLAPAAHANAIAAGSDPSGDAADPAPGRDIVAAALGYDRRTGTVRGGVALRGASTEDARAFVSVSAGVRTPSGCDGYPAIALSSFTTDALVRWTRFDAAGPPSASGDARKETAGGARLNRQGPDAGGRPGGPASAPSGTAGELQTFEVTDPALRGLAVDCLTAVVTDPADPSNVLDSFGPVAFEPLPELEAKLGRPPGPLVPGRTRNVTLALRNPGDAPTGPIRLAVGGERGLTAAVAKRVPSLKPGERRKVRIAVTLSRRARTTTPLRVTVTAGKLRVRAEATLARGARPPKDTGDDGSSVCAGYTPVLGGVGEIVVYPC